MTTLEVGILCCFHCGGRSFTVLCDIRGKNFNKIGETKHGVKARVDQIECLSCGEGYALDAKSNPIRRR